MVLPRLIHPIPTDIQSFDPQSTIQDDGYEEPVQIVEYGTTFTVNAQWKWFSDKELQSQNYGAEEKSDGYVLMRRVDLLALGQSIKRGDRIGAYGVGANRLETDLYITKVRHEGHYPDQGGPALVKAYFSDRQPSRQTPGV